MREYVQHGFGLTSKPKPKEITLGCKYYNLVPILNCFGGQIFDWREIFTVNFPEILNKQNTRCDEGGFRWKIVLSP